ncbi:MAG: hypothetical protein L6R37_003835 [Teloschistes peruensis]|nr:MAG: hypothetical protein L6R37_003835 [Teloschistes peruensis]
MPQLLTADHVYILVPPSTLTIQALPCGPPLEDSEIFLLTLLTAGRLAKLPWGGATARYGLYRTENTSNIALLVRGGYPHGGFEVKMTIWGLSIATRFMIESKEFCFRRFVLSLDGRSIGDLDFRPVSSSTDVETMMLEDSKDILQAGSNISTADAGFPLTIRISNLPGPEMSIGDIVMTLLGGFEDVAFRGFSTQIHSGHFITSRRQYRVALDFHVVFPPPLAAPVWFTCEIVWGVMEALVKSYFLEQRRRRTPALISMTKDGMLAGSGIFSYLPAIGAPSAGENVTTS